MQDRSKQKFVSNLPLLNLTMKLRGGDALRASPPLNFIAKISNASNL